MARQLVADFGDIVQMRYHDISQPDEPVPEDVGRAVEEQQLIYPVSVVNGEVVAAGDVSYFVLSDKIKMLTQAHA